MGGLGARSVRLLRQRHAQGTCTHHSRRLTVFSETNQGLAYYIRPRWTKWPSQPRIRGRVRPISNPGDLPALETAVTRARTRARPSWRTPSWGRRRTRQHGSGAKGMRTAPERIALGVAPARVGGDCWARGPASGRSLPFAGSALGWSSAESGQAQAGARAAAPAGDADAGAKGASSAGRCACSAASSSATAMMRGCLACAGSASPSLCVLSQQVAGCH